SQDWPVHTGRPRAGPPRLRLDRAGRGLWPPPCVEFRQRDHGESCRLQGGRRPLHYSDPASEGGLRMHRVPEFDQFVDGRGEIRDLLRDAELDSVTLIRTNRGGIRGNHYHRATSQWTYVISGRVRWVTQMPGEEAQEDVAGPGSFVLSPPEERHA